MSFGMQGRSSFRFVSIWLIAIAIWVLMAGSEVLGCHVMGISEFKVSTISTTGFGTERTVCPCGYYAWVKWSSAGPDNDEENWSNEKWILEIWQPGTPGGGGDGHPPSGTKIGYATPGHSAREATIHITNASALTIGTHTIRAWVKRDKTSYPHQWDYSSTCTVNVAGVDCVDEDMTTGCIDNPVHFTAYLDPSMAINCVDWEVRYRESPSDPWTAYATPEAPEYYVHWQWLDLTSEIAGQYQFRARNGSCDGWKQSDVVTIVKVKIEYMEMPDDFVALPDPDITADIPSATQETSTDIWVKYSIYPSGYSFGTVELNITLGTKNKAYNLSATSGLNNTEVVTVQLDNTWAAYEQTVYVTLIGTETPLGCTDSQYVQGKRLLSGLYFSPWACDPDFPVCPYTHYHYALSGSSPDNDWYGLEMSWYHPVTIDALIVKVSGGDIVGNKQLSVMTSALLPPWNPLSDRRVKWEGYDHTITEPADVPYCVFPEDVSTQPAPEHVVKEGDYIYYVEAQNKQFVSPPGQWIYQTHKIQNIPIYVRYNMSDSEL